MTALPAEVFDTRHPWDDLLRADRLPHIWCPGCGLGNVLRCYLEAVRKSGTPVEKHVVVSGIGCTARIPGYINLDSYHTTHGRPIPFATGMKIVKPELQVTVISGDGDLFTIGGNHIIHAARRNVDLNIFCVNNFNYGMTGGQVGATTPLNSRTATTPYGNIEPAFNLPDLMKTAGAVFVARWTTLHVHQLTRAITEAMSVPGFSFIEILSPCPPTYGKLNFLPQGLDQMEFFRKHCVVDHRADLRNAGLTMKAGDTIVLGNFVKRTQSSYHELERRMIERVRGSGK